MSRAVTGYESHSVKLKDIRVSRKKPAYALMPVWLLSTKWKDKTFLFAMNGQTGKMVSDLPVDMGKFWLIFACIFVPLAVIMALILL